MSGIGGAITPMIKRQRDFSAGEIDPNAAGRDDRPEFKNGIRYGRNVNTGNEGWLSRRAGRSVLYLDEGVRDEFRPFPDRFFSITFAAERFTARFPNGLVAKQLTAPWTDDMVPLLRWVLAGDTIFVCGPAPLRPLVIFYDRDLDDWAITDYAFEVSLNGTARAPFYRFGQKGVTAQPGALTGATTVTFSEAVLLPAHAGVLFRYAGKQFRIDTVNSPTSAAITILEKLNPTVKVHCTSVAEAGGFVLGQEVETSVTGMKGTVVAIDGADITFVVTNHYRKQDDSDRLIGPTADADLDGESFVDPAAFVQWDEQFMSDCRGWPSAVSLDVQRLIFCGFPQAKNFILWSATSGFFDCLIGDSATSAILEYIPRECQVLHVIGGYDEFALTDQGAYYIPISAGQPLQPGSVEFRLIYSGSIANVMPLQVTEGVLFVDGSGSRIHAITATGQTARPYVADEITRFHQHLFSDVRGLAATNNDPQISGRQMYALNGDGTVVVGRYWADKDYVGWFKWDGGAVRSISSRYEDVVFSTDYEGDAGIVSVAEKLDASTKLDCTFSLSLDGGFDVLEMGDGTTFLFDDGEEFHLSSYTLAAFAGSTMQIVADGFYYGNAVVGDNGEMPFPTGRTGITVGFNINIEVQPLLEDFEGGDDLGQRLRRRKVAKVMARVKDTGQFAIGDRQFATYRQGEDMGEPLEARTDVFKYRQAGRSYDPNYSITQTIPGGFKLLELTTEMTV